MAVRHNKLVALGLFLAAPPFAATSQKISRDKFHIDEPVGRSITTE